MNKKNKMRNSNLSTDLTINFESNTGGQLMCKNNVEFNEFLPPYDFYSTDKSMRKYMNEADHNRKYHPKSQHFDRNN